MAVFRDGTFKFWSDGDPFVGKMKVDQAGFKYWFDGLPFIGTNNTGGASTFPALFIAP